MCHPSSRSTRFFGFGCGRMIYNAVLWNAIRLQWSRGSAEVLMPRHGFARVVRLGTTAEAAHGGRRRDQTSRTVKSASLRTLRMKSPGQGCRPDVDPANGEQHLRGTAPRFRSDRLHGDRSGNTLDLPLLRLRTSDQVILSVLSSPL